MELAELLGVLFIVWLTFQARGPITATVLNILCGFLLMGFGFGWYDYYKDPTGLITSLVYAGVGGLCWVIAIMTILDWWKSK